MKIVQYLKENYWLTAILFFGAFLRFYKLDFQSIWLDEIHTMIECNPKISFKESYDIAAFREQMPQLYFLCIKLFSTILGHTPFVVRMFSALIGVVSLYAIYLLGKELKNSKTGLIAAALLAVNYFHIWYSQEGRPYAMFALMAIFSFYRLIIFIKRSTLKNALYYGLFSALMIDTHFFGLFVLVSQAIIILFFLFELPKEARMDFFKLSLIAGVTTIVLWLPSLKVFFDVMEIKSFWIQPPSLEVYSQLFKEFFGNSEAVLIMAFLMAIFYFLKVFTQKKEEGVACKDNPILLSFVLFSSWIFITLFIPILRSYLDIPMIVSRYFIGVLPAVILIIAIGISSIKTNLVQRIIILFFVVTSLTDIIVIKDYYNKIGKTQYREITETIIKRNKDRDKVVSSYGWCMSYFLNEDATNTPLLQASSAKNVAVECTFENYISLMKNGTIPMDSFWYMDGTSRPYALTPDDEKFMTDNFTQDASIAMNDTWTRHYISKSRPSAHQTDTTFDIKNFTPYTVNENGNFALFESSTVSSPEISLEKGRYELIIDANSTPEKPLNGENAHIVVKLGNKELANYYLSEKQTEKRKIIPFESTENSKQKITITFDNDLSANGLDRNVVIYNVSIEKK